MYITKRSGVKEELNISKIQKMTIESTEGLNGVSQSELEVDAKIKFVDGMSSSNIQDSLIKTAVEKIDIDRPNWTFVASRLFLYDLYHRVGRTINDTFGEIKKYTNYGDKLTDGIPKFEKGSPYCHLKTYLTLGKYHDKILPNLGDGFDIDALDEYLKPERDTLFNYLGVKTLYDRYLIKNNNGDPLELPQQMFMGIAMFLARNETSRLSIDQNDPEYNYIYSRGTSMTDEERASYIRTYNAKKFYDIISKFEVMLATPTLSNARTNRHQLSSCYIGSTPDNIEGIFDSYHEMALLSKYGGGIGWDWNQIRSLGGSIDGNKSAAGGTVPFLKIANDLALAVDQLGTRKGAIAVYLEPWHSDIEDFIDLKKNSGEERRRAHDLFPAVWLCDLFMDRVKENGDWTLFDPYETPELMDCYGEEFNKLYVQYENNDNIYKRTIKAKDLWKKILLSYFESGSPFIGFKDTANRANPNNHVGLIRSSNLCTEIFQNTEPNTYKVKVWVGDKECEFITFEEDDVVELSNGTTKLAKKLTALDKLVDNKYYLDKKHNIRLKNIPASSKCIDGDMTMIYNVEKEKIDGETAVCNLASINLGKIHTREDIKRVTPIAVRMLDNVIDLNFYPLNKVKKTNLKSRAIGLGVMGKAEMLAIKGIHWDSQKHYDVMNGIMEAVSYNTIKTSSDLAVEKGIYPNFKGSNWSKGIMPHDFANEEVNKLTTTKNYYDWDTLREKVKNDGIRNGYLMAIAPTSSISILTGTTQSIEPVYKRKWYEENLSGLIPVVVPNLNPDTWEYYTPAYEVDQIRLAESASIQQKWIDQGQSLNFFANPQKTTGGELSKLYLRCHALGVKSTYYLRSQSPEAINDVEDRSMECEGCQ